MPIKKVFIHGRDNVNWSIDSDRKHLENFLDELNIQRTRFFILANIVHSVWWNALLSYKSIPLLYKKLIATATNYIELTNRGFNKIKKHIDLWIAPNKKQLELFKDNDIPVVYQPFYVDEQTFYYLNKSKEELCHLLNLDYEVIKRKFLMGSFQRDSLGSDLSKPKWQKNPELFLDILEELPHKDKWLLVLAGPRRHYLITQCKKRNIPYYYYGKMPSGLTDDISINTLNKEKMNLLYNLIDLYIISSKSEGGPKAVLEAAWCKTMVISTDVGLAPDVLDSLCMYETKNDAVKFIMGNALKENVEILRKCIQNNYNNVSKICGFDAIKKRWQKIYETL